MESSVSAASITNPVVADAANPPATSVSALWSTSGLYLQTRPTGDKFLALMVTLTNNTGSDLPSFTVGYTFTQIGVVAEEVPGHRVYFSLTGGTNSWINLPVLSSVSPGSLVTNINITWPSNRVAYLLWADDNGTNAETGNQIDNFFISASLPPVIVSPPQSLLACPGNPGAFTVTASGSMPLRYQWRKITPTSTNDIGSATNAVFSISSVSTNEEAGYCVVVANSSGSITSAVATLSLSTNPVAITAHPQEIQGIYGSLASFTVGLDPAAAQPFYFQWYRVGPNGSNPLSGQTQPTLTLDIYETNVASYFVIVSNCVNAATSQLASLSLFYTPLEITGQPVSAQVDQGGSVTFTVGVAGSRPAYQWYKGSTLLSGATNASLILTNLVPTDSGYYHVEAHNPYPSHVASSSVALVVSTPSYVIVPLTNTAVFDGFTNGIWRYSQNAVDLGTAWRAVGYDDSTWPSGLGVLAKEDNVLVLPLIHTVLSLTNTAGATNLTFYFRTTFNLTNDLSLAKIITSNLVDDAHVVYVNGVEAYRSTNMPTGTVTYNTLAKVAHAENVWEVAEIPSSLLIRGTNTLAVEVHQSATTSADVVLGLTVLATFLAPSTPPVITKQPASLTGVEFKPAALTVGYSGEAVTLQWFKQHTNDAGADPVPGGIGPTLTIPRPILGVDDGPYFVVLSNLLGAVASRSAWLTLTPGATPPLLLDADGTTNWSTVVLAFDEPLLLFEAGQPSASPTNLDNFTITNTFGESLTVTSAQFTNGTNIILTTTPPRREGANYIATVRRVADLSPQHNPALNVAVPVSSRLPLVDFVDYYWFAQPSPGLDSIDEFTNGTWRLPEFDPSVSGTAWFFPGWSAFWLGTVSQTSVPCGTELSIGLISSYYRKPFDFPASPAGLRASWQHLVNDGAVFYLNGVELSRFNMPTGAVGLATTALASVVTRNPAGPFDLPSGILRPGGNILAVELHASASNAVSLLMAAELQARIESLVTGPVVITTSPADLTVTAGGTAAFSFRGAAGRTFQWFSNDVAIVGATNPVCLVPNVPLSANGASYRVEVTGATNTVLSPPARLTVLPDTHPPALVSAYVTDSNAITVTFSEPVTASTATNILNYAVTNILGDSLSITSVTLVDGTNALLRVSALPGGFYIVVVNNVADTAATPNSILPNSPVTLGVQDFPLVAVDAATLWRYNTNGIDLGNAWRTAFHDDSTWPLGAALFDGKKTGRSAGDLATNMPDVVRTVLPVTNPSSANAIPTYYFRTQFHVPALASQGATLSLRHVVDDGAAFYLNGQLLYSTRVIVPTTFAAYGGTSSPIKSSTLDFPIYEGLYSVPSTYLTAGANLLAVEVKNVNATSADITFGASLYLTVPSIVLPAGDSTNPPPSPPLLFVAREDSGQVKLWWTNAGPLVLESADQFDPTGTAWTPVSIQTNPHIAPATNATRFYRLRQ